MSNTFFEKTIRFLTFSIFFWEFLHNNHSINYPNSTIHNFEKNVCFRRLIKLLADGVKKCYKYTKMGGANFDIYLLSFVCKFILYYGLLIFAFNLWKIGFKLNLKETKQDQLPKRIRLECRLMLRKSFLFRNKCKNSDSKLRRHIRLINAGMNAEKGFLFFFSNNKSILFIKWKKT